MQGKKKTAYCTSGGSRSPPAALESHLESQPTQWSVLRLSVWVIKQQKQVATHVRLQLCARTLRVRRPWRNKQGRNWKKKNKERTTRQQRRWHLAGCGVHGEGRDYSASVSRKDLCFLSPPSPQKKKSAPSGYCLHYCGAPWNKSVLWLHSNATVTTSVLASASSRCPEAGPHQAPGFHINIGAGSGDNNPAVFMNTSVFTVEVWRVSRARGSARSLNGSTHTAAVPRDAVMALRAERGPPSRRAARKTRRARGCVIKPLTCGVTSLRPRSRSRRLCCMTTCWKRCVFGLLMGKVFGFFFWFFGLRPRCGIGSGH